MPIHELNAIILGQLKDRRAHAIPELVRHALESNSGLYESEVKSALLGLVRRNKLDVTDDFKIQLPQQSVTSVG